MVSISNKDLYENITINKIYLDIPNSRFEQSINNNNNKKDYDNIFNNISLNYIKNNSNKLISNIEITKNNKIQSYNDNNITNNFKFEKDNNITNNFKFEKDNNITNYFKFEKDSFINELSNLLMKNTREIRNEIKNFVNSSENLDYLKKLTRSYKKFIIDIHNLLVNDNIDKIITDNLLIIICKLYNINIIIFKENIYKIYENNNSSDYYVFEKYIKNNENNKNNKNNKYINFRLIDSIKNINDFLKEKKIYKDEKELKNMKLDELRNLANKNKIVSTKKKIDLINELNKIYNLYN